MSIMLLSPGIDDVTWLSLAFMTLIVDGRDDGFWYVSFCPCFVSVFDALPPRHLQSDYWDLWSHVACLLITPFFLS